MAIAATFAAGAVAISSRGTGATFIEGGVASSVAFFMASDMARVSCNEYVGAVIGTYFIVFTGSGSVRAAMPPFSAPPVATAATLEPSPVVGIGADRGFNPSFRAARSSGVIGTFTLEAIDDCIAWAGVLDVETGAVGVGALAGVTVVVLD
mgnify:FL=1